MSSKTIICVGLNGSMQTTDCNGMTRYEAATELAMRLLGPTGRADIILFGHRAEIFRDMDVDMADRLFKKSKPIQTAVLTNLALFMAQNVHAGSNSTSTQVFVVTDAAPTSVDGTLDALKDIVAENDITVTIVTVGEIGAAFGRFLEAADTILQGAR